MTPQRIQRKRMRGWKMPKGAIYVGRPTQWGNPFEITDERDARDVVIAYSIWLQTKLTDAEREDLLAPLRGHDLACWCPIGKPCHADVLLELCSNSEKGEGDNAA